MPTCIHQTTELRLRTLSNNTTAVQRQCTICGDSVGSAVKKLSLPPEQFESLPAWDNALRETYRQIEQQHYKEERERQEEEWNSESPARKAEYLEYLQSPVWKAKRDATMRRDGYVCQGCHAALATQVHHLTYKHRGDELLWELVSVCDPCHRRAHQ